MITVLGGTLPQGVAAATVITRWRPPKVIVGTGDGDVRVAGQ